MQLLLLSPHLPSQRTVSLPTLWSITVNVSLQNMSSMSLLLVLSIIFHCHAELIQTCENKHCKLRPRLNQIIHNWEKKTIKMAWCNSVVPKLNPKRTLQHISTVSKSENAFTGSLNGAVHSHYAPRQVWYAVILKLAIYTCRFPVRTCICNGFAHRTNHYLTLKY